MNLFLNQRYCFKHQCMLVELFRSSNKKTMVPIFKFAEKNEIGKRGFDR